MSVSAEPSAVERVASRSVASGLLVGLVVELMWGRKAIGPVDVAAVVLSALVLYSFADRRSCDSAKRHRDDVFRVVAICAAALCAIEMVRTGALQSSALLLGAAILQLSYAQVAAVRT